MTAASLDASLELFGMDYLRDGLRVGRTRLNRRSP
jgi:hypothetical protein